jgi:hypothetical protein
MNVGWQPDDPTWRVLRHFFLHRHRHSANIDAELVCLHSHGCAHAGPERCSNQIGRRKCFAFASIVGWGVGFERGLRRSVHRIAMKVASVLNGNFDHMVIMRRVAIFVMSSRVETSHYVWDRYRYGIESPASSGSRRTALRPRLRFAPLGMTSQ